MALDVVREIVVVLLASAVAVAALHPLRLSPIIGYILAGVLIGPHGLSLVPEVERVEAIAEIGVVLLLFSIGLELSLARLRRLLVPLIGGGGLQFVLTAVPVGLAAFAAIGNWRQALFVGFLVTLSSTAIVLKVLADRGQIDSPHGQLAVGVLIFQDLMVVPLILVTPLLAGTGGDGVARALVTAFVVVTFTLAAGRWVVPLVLQRVLLTRSSELFLVTIFVICIGTAWLTSLAGLSLALGAFLAGVAIADTEYGHQAMAEVLPLRNALTGVFFVSVGMLVDLTVLTGSPGLVLGLTAAVIGLKVVSATAAGLLLRWHGVAALLAGLGLANIGEFSFVLAALGHVQGLLSDNYFQLFVIVAALSMLAAPLLMQGGPRVLRLFLPPLTRAPAAEAERSYAALTELRELREHVVIVGFGMSGRNLAHALKAAGVPYAIVEMNSRTVSAMRAQGEPIVFGDASRRTVLHHVGVPHAKVLVLAVSDPGAVRTVTALARAESERLHIVVRTRYAQEVDELRRLGANEVIPEEYETALEIFARVLAYIGQPHNVVQRQVAAIRESGYRMLRDPRLGELAPERSAQLLAGLTTVSYRIEPGAPACGRSIGQLGLRAHTGATVVAVRRGDGLVSGPGPELAFAAGDELVVAGSDDQVAAAVALLDQAAVPE